MKFTPTKIEGVWIVEMERHHDERGWFARTWCMEEFRAQGLDADLVQCSSSFNLHRGTLRGMHYQAAPHGETKLVRCTRGAVFDVALDLRPNSATFTQSIYVELTADNGRALYLPEGIAHGFQTLADDSEVYYQMSEFFHPESAKGLRWDDPAFDIQWPIEKKIVSPKDNSYQAFSRRSCALYVKQ